MRCLLVFLFLIFTLNSCSKDNPEVESLCGTVLLDSNKNYNALLGEFEPSLLLSTVEQPDDSGALGRNKASYFHVRFQINMSKLTDIAIASQRTDALAEFLKNLEYSFNYQEENGDFKLIPPPELANNPDIPPANTGDRVSAVAFFAYSLGLSLMSLENADWYLNSPETELLRTEIKQFDSSIALTLNFLKANKNILQQVDQNAPNRLFFDAIAFYSLGNYLGDPEASEIGIDFMESALELVDENSGYFIEGGGWDSSYNGVALKLGLEMFSMLPTSHIKETLRQKLVCAMDWQITRILPDGEISTEGNTRVFPGGEAFLGNEKTVDVEKTIRALKYFAFLTNNSLYNDLANQVLDFYR
jgi:hypothetical protein